MKKRLFALLIVMIMTVLALAGCKWLVSAEPSEYTVSFEVNGGTTVDPVVVKRGDLLTKPEDPTKGYDVFAGWYTDAEFNALWNFEKDRVDADITLYAKWTDHVCTGGAATCTEKAVCSVCGESYGSELGHNMVTDPAVAPTCTETGLTEGSHCSRCDDATTAQNTVSALGHTWSDWTETLAPTDTAEGQERRDCTRAGCDEYETRTVPSLSHTHSYTSSVTTPATCEEDGVMTYTCSCRHSYTEAIPATGHDWDDGEVTSEATYGHAGTATFTCENDDSHTKTESIPQLTLGANATAAEIVNAAYSLEKDEALIGTFTLTGVITKVDYAYSASNNNISITIKVTGADETKTIYCFKLTGTGISEIAVGDTVTITGPIKNYNGKVEFDQGCVLDSYVAHTHQWSTATCQSLAKCSICHNTTGGLADHAYENGQCKWCEKDENAAEVVENWVLVTDASKLTNGAKIVIVAAGEVNYALSTTQNNNNRAATAITKVNNTVVITSSVQVITVGIDENGNYTFYVEGDKTGYLYAAGGTSSNNLKTTEKLDAKGTWTIEITAEGIATIKCTDEGTTKNTIRYNPNNANNSPLFSCYASGQQDVSIYVLDNGPAHEHEGTKVNGQASSCTEDGWKDYYSCTCNKFFSDAACENEIEDLAAWKTGEGKVAKLGHEMGAWRVITAPTCTEKGEERRDCSRCDHFETQEVAATGHSYASKVTAPTCTEGGYTTYTCACGSTYTGNEVAATGHTYGDWTITKQPTETEVGSQYRTCTVANCGHVDTKEIPVLGHTHSVTFHEAKDATCTANGNSAYWSCACGKFFSDADATTEIAENSWVISATGHVTLTHHEAKDATCTANGNIEYWSCVCGKAFSDAAATVEINTWVIETKGHSLTHHAATAVTCEANGNSEYWSCSVCGKFFSDANAANEVAENSWVIESEGHNFENGTCTNDGCDETDPDYYVTMTLAEVLAGTVGTKVRIANVVVTDIYQKYSAQHGNVSLYVTDGTATIIVFQIPAEDANTYTVGDVITVTGNIGVYKNVNQIAAGATGVNHGKADKYTVTFDSNGGTAVESKEAYKYSNVEAPTAPTKESTATHRYTFAGWYLGETKYDFTTPVTGNITLVARWTETEISGDEEEETWTLVTDVSQLTDGAQIVIVAAGYDYALGAQNSTFRDRVAITKNANGTVEINENVQIITLVIKDGKFLLMVDDGQYLYAGSTSNNYLKTGTTVNAAAKWDITIDDDGKATIKSNIENTERNTLMYNSNANSERFSCYAGTGKAVCIYVKTGSSTPSQPEHTCADVNKDHVCDNGCGIAQGEHKDTNKDHNCDYGCSEKIGTHAAAEGSHNCEYCNKPVSECADGDNNHNCDVCGEPLTGHTGGNPTCTKQAVCTICNQPYGELAQHTPAEAKIENEVKATCTAGGSYDSVVYCSACKTHEISRETVTVTSTGHTEETLAAVEATCESTGLTEGKKCKTCGVVTVTQKETDALGHSFKTYTYNNDAKCEVNGTETAKCERCNETDTRTAENTALEHSFTKYVSNGDATCLENGTETAKCDRCEETHTREDDNSALGHSFTKYVSNNDAKCEVNGTETAKCDRCDVTNKRVAEGSALTHLFTEYTLGVRENTVKYVSNCDHNCGTEDKRDVATTTEIETSDESLLRAALVNGYNVKLNGDVTLTEAITLVNGKVVTIDLAGHTITANWATTDPNPEGLSYNDPSYKYVVVEVLYLEGAGTTVTIKDSSEGKTGGMISGDETSYSKDYLINSVISVLDGATLNIYSGNFYSANIGDVVFAKSNTEDNLIGTVNIYGGKFEAANASGGKYYVLDTRDTAIDRGVFNVYGGSFVGFNPANHTNDGKDYTNKLAGTGYHSIKDENNVYTVSKHTYTKDDYRCDGCGANKCDHSYDNVVTAPTCNDKGYTTHTCSICNDSYVDSYVDATGHKDENKDHVCDNGCEVYQGEHKDTNKDHNCDYGCSVKIGTHEAAERSHNCGYCNAKMSDCSGGTATCTEKATCEACGSAHGELDSDNHSSEETYYTNNGETHTKKHSCCNADVETVAHVYDHACDTTCDLCGATREITHTYGDWTSNGNTHTHTCTVVGCGHSETGNCSGGTATCTKKATCETCGSAHGDLNLNNHVNTTEHAETPATCLEVGYTAGTYCKDCETWISGHEEIEAINHKNKEYHEKVDATCTATGTIEYWSCEDCDKNYSDEDCTVVVTNLVIDVNANAHDWNEGEVTTTPTCSTTGVKTYTCKHNGKHTYTEEIDTLPHTGLNNDGTGICSVCNYKATKGWTLVNDISTLQTGDQIIFVAKNLNVALGKQNGNYRDIVSVTKTNNGITSIDAATIITIEVIGDGVFAFKTDDGYLCAVAGDDNYLKVETKLSDYGKWSIAKDENNNLVIKSNGKDAVKNILIYNTSSPRFSCYGAFGISLISVEMYTNGIVEISAHAHDGGTATCEVQAKCNICSEYYGPLANHTSNGAATCETPETCKVCKVEIAPSLGHNVDEHEANETTCTENGNIAYWSCSVCGKFFSDADATTEIEENSWIVEHEGHNYVSGVCTKCFAKQCPNGHTDGPAATCENDQVCTVCGTVLESAPGHVWSEEFIIDQEATCKEAGSQSKHCTREGCDAKDEVTEIAQKTIHSDKNGDNICDVCENAIKVSNTASLSFANTAQRTEFSTSKQVWKQNGITFTNNKASSTSNVANYSNPVRLYASSSVTIEFANMTKIEFVCNSSSHATALKNSIGDSAIVTINDAVVIAEFKTPVNNFTISKLTAQVQLKSITVTSEISLALPTYTVEFKNYDGTSLQTLTVVEGQYPNYTAGIPTRATDNQYEYTFKDWDKDTDKCTENTVYTATYTATPRYTVTFDSNGGSPVESQTVTSGKYAIAPSNPVFEGYRFLGWFDGDTEWNFTENAVESNITLEARWEEIPDDVVMYTVTFNVDGNLTEVEVESGNTVDKPTDPTKDGYNFLGWYNGETKFDFNTAIDSDITLVAKWEEIKQTVGVIEGGTADLSGSNSNSYGSVTTKGGWTATNSRSDEYFDTADNEIVLNGKNSAAGVLTSPTITTGISKITFKYGLPFSDSKIGFRIDIIQNGRIVATKTINPNSVQKQTAYDGEWILDQPILGAFTIKITNICPSNKNSNTDRVAIWNISWDGWGIQ